jgi:ABC-type nitrate/sulfonate/bicarbonate transport system substrate-binding protein
MKRRSLYPQSGRWGLAAAVLATLGLALGGCADSNTITVGHSGGPLLGALYLAAESSEWDDEWFELAKFGTSADVAYALISEDLDAGFVAPASLVDLEKLPEFTELTAIGKISFPYGATIVVREGLSLRLSDLNGHKMAIAEPECELLTAVLHDAERLGLDLSGIELVVMPFDAMIPALEAGRIDAALLKGSYAAVAEREGHTILYQNWTLDEQAAIEAGDTCCNLTLEQLELVLLARRDSAATGRLPELLEAAQALGVDPLRQAAAQETGIPLATLEGLPMPTFELADDALIAELTGYLAEEEGEEGEEGEEIPDEEG